MNEGARKANELMQKQAQLDALREIIKKLDLLIELLDEKAIPALDNSLRGISKLTIVSEEEAAEFDDYVPVTTGIDDRYYNYAQDDLNFDTERERRSR